MAVAGFQIATFPKCGGGSRRLIATLTTGKVVESYWSGALIRKWLSGASASRPGTHNAKRSGAGNVPLFYPGSRLAGRHARISGFWSYPTGQAVREREAVLGGSSARRGGVSWIFFPFFFWMQSDSERNRGLFPVYGAEISSWMSWMSCQEAAEPPFECFTKRVAPNDETPVEWVLAGAFSAVCSGSQYF